MQFKKQKKTESTSAEMWREMWCQIFSISSQELSCCSNVYLVPYYAPASLFWYVSFIRRFAGSRAPINPNKSVLVVCSKRATTTTLPTFPCIINLIPVSAKIVHQSRAGNNIFCNHLFSSFITPNF